MVGLNVKLKALVWKDLEDAPSGYPVVDEELVLIMGGDVPMIFEEDTKMDDLLSRYQGVDFSGVELVDVVLTTKLYDKEKLIKELEDAAEEASSEFDSLVAVSTGTTSSGTYTWSQPSSDPSGIKFYNAEADTVPDEVHQETTQE